MKLRDWMLRLRGKLVGRVGVEPTTKRLRVSRPCRSFHVDQHTFPLSHWVVSRPYAPYLEAALRDWEAA